MIFVESDKEVKASHGGPPRSQPSLSLSRDRIVRSQSAVTSERPHCSVATTGRLRSAISIAEGPVIIHSCSSSFVAAPPLPHSSPSSELRRLFFSHPFALFSVCLLLEKYNAHPDGIPTPFICMNGWGVSGLPTPVSVSLCV